MRKIIHHIRKQPEEVRRHILHILTMCFAFILVVLWVYSLGNDLASSDIKAKVSNDLKPLSALKGNIIGGYNSITGTDLDTQE
jgi:hypothetical protein